MSLYEIMSMVAALSKGSKKVPTKSELEEFKQRWRNMNLPDVRIN